MITCKSWSNTKPLQRDAHGEWSQGEVSLKKEKKKGTYIILNLSSLPLLLQINYYVKNNPLHWIRFCDRNFFKEFAKCFEDM